MKKIVIISAIIILVVAADALAFLHTFGKAGAPYLRLENFIKQSSQQISNPLYAVSVPKPDPEIPAKAGEVAKAPPAFACQKSTDFSCYEKYYRALVKNEGVAAAFADLKIRYKGSSYVASQCHPITHIIGQAAVDKYPDVSEAYLHGDSFCWSGYYHGVLEGIAFKMGKDKLLANLNDICAGIPGKATYSFDYYNCVHGLGHGLMSITDDELFDSLKFCDNLTGSWEEQSCYGGVFMENIIMDNKNHFTKYLKPAEPLYPCLAVDDKYKSTCYLMQTSYMLKVTNRDFARVFELCSQVEDAFRPQCYQSLGRDASDQSLSNAAATKTTCALGKNYEQTSNCIIGAVKDFVSYYHSDTQAKQLCESLDPDLQGICNTTAANYYQTFK